MLGALGSADKYSTASVTHTTELSWHCWIQILRSCSSSEIKAPALPQRANFETKNASSVTCTSVAVRNDPPLSEEFGTCIDRF